MKGEGLFSSGEAAERIEETLRHSEEENHSMEL